MSSKLDLPVEWTIHYLSIHQKQLNHPIQAYSGRTMVLIAA